MKLRLEILVLFFFVAVAFAGCTKLEAIEHGCDEGVDIELRDEIIDEFDNGDQEESIDSGDELENDGDDSITDDEDEDDDDDDGTVRNSASD